MVVKKKSRSKPVVAKRAHRSPTEAGDLDAIARAALLSSDPERRVQALLAKRRGVSWFGRLQRTAKLALATRNRLASPPKLVAASAARSATNESRHLSAAKARTPELVGISGGRA